MNVQIFMLEENKQLIYDNDQLAEFQSLVSELGLKCNNTIDPEKSPIPYLQLDQATIRAFHLLCPQIDKIKEYRFEIPLEILRHVKLSETEKYFDWIEVWSNTKDPDPFCVGKVYKTASDRQSKYTWNATYYLIGRWGAENKTMDELMSMAIKLATTRIEIYTESCIAKLNSWKSCPEVWAKKYIFNDDQEAQRAFSESNSLPF